MLLYEIYIVTILQDYFSKLKSFQLLHYHIMKPIISINV